MTPRQFLDGFRQDKRLVTGGFYDPAPVAVVPGDVVGVVLMSRGGPAEATGVEEFYYNRLMDPAAVDAPLPAGLRERACRFVAFKLRRHVARKYAMVGGTSPIARHTREQARAVERRLNSRFGPVTGAQYRTYVATRYGTPSSEDAAAEMARDGVTKVVLLPLYPQYAKATTGSALAYWKALEEANEMAVWPTTLVYEYAAHPKYIQAVSERIDEALQRFPRDVRDRVALLFSACGSPSADQEKRNDPYCCLVHTTVQEVMRYRAERGDAPRAFRVTYQNALGLAKGVGPSTATGLDELIEEGHAAVLAVSVSSVADHIDTTYELDIALREEAFVGGLEHFEVTTGLNCHPLFVEALAEAVVAQVAMPAASGDGMPDELPSPIAALPRYSAAERSVRCAACPLTTEAHDWRGQAAAKTPVPHDVLIHSGCPIPNTSVLTRRSSGDREG